MCGNGEGAVGWFVGGAAILVFNGAGGGDDGVVVRVCLLYTSPSPRD